MGTLLSLFKEDAKRLILSMEETVKNAEIFSKYVPELKEYLEKHDSTSILSSLKGAIECGNEQDFEKFFPEAQRFMWEFGGFFFSILEKIPKK